MLLFVNKNRFTQTIFEEDKSSDSRGSCNFVKAFPKIRKIVLYPISKGSQLEIIRISSVTFSTCALRNEFRLGVLRLAVPPNQRSKFYPLLDPGCPGAQLEYILIYGSWTWDAFGGPSMCATICLYAQVVRGICRICQLAWVSEAGGHTQIPGQHL